MNILGYSRFHLVESLFTENILPSLIQQQKKIIIIDSLALGFLAACYVIGWCCYKSNMLTGDDKNDDKNDDENDDENVTFDRVENEVNESEDDSLIGNKRIFSSTDRL